MRHISPNHLLGIVLLFLGLAAVKPLLTMAGSVIIVAMIAISLREYN